MNEQELIERVVGAHRTRTVDGEIVFSPAWHDLSTADRLKAHDAAVLQRRLEAAMDSDGQSTTVRAVLLRIRTTGR